MPVEKKTEESEREREKKNLKKTQQAKRIFSPFLLLALQRSGHSGRYVLH